MPSPNPGPKDSAPSPYYTEKVNDLPCIASIIRVTYIVELNENPIPLGGFKKFTGGDQFFARRMSHPIHPDDRVDSLD